MQVYNHELYQKAKTEYMNSSSNSKTKIHKNSEKKFIDTQKLAKEKTAKIVGRAIMLIGGMTLSAYATSRK